MTRLQHLTALRDKVKAGTVPITKKREAWRLFDFEGAGYAYRVNVNAANAYLGSLNAAKALHEALLPGWLVAAINQADVPGTVYNADAEWSVRLWNSVDDDGWQYPASGASTPARAWLLAILEALIAQDVGE